MEGKSVGDCMYCLAPNNPRKQLGDRHEHTTFSTVMPQTDRLVVPLHTPELLFLSRKNGKKTMLETAR